MGDGTVFWEWLTSMSVSSVVSGNPDETFTYACVI